LQERKNIHNCQERERTHDYENRELVGTKQKKESESLQEREIIVGKRNICNCQKRRKSS
jgi:hypothetical protein